MEFFSVFNNSFRRITTHAFSKAAKAGAVVLANMFLRSMYLYNFAIAILTTQLSFPARIQGLTHTNQENGRLARFFPALAIDEIDRETEEDQRCIDDVRTLQQSALNDSLWATMMMDATSAYPAGVLHESRYHMGNFDGCMLAAKKSPVGARYCIARLSFKRGLPLPHAQGDNRTKPCAGCTNTEDENPFEDWSVFMAVCIPESCRENLVQRMMQKELQSKRSALTAVDVSPNLCTDVQNPSYTGLKVFSLAVAALVGLAALATLLDMKEMVSSTGSFGWILSWSVPRRWHEFLQPEKPVRGVPLQSLSAIRLASLIFIVVAHHTMQIPRTALTMQFVSPQEFQNPLITPVTHPYVPLYSMFYLSGLFLSLTATGSFFPTVILRFLRCTPSYMAVVAFYALAYKSLGSGPLWKTVVNPEADACATLWWTNFLYVNNYVRPHLAHGCIVQSWTIAVDLQFYIVGTLLLLALKKWKRIGLVLFGIAIAISMVVPFVTTLVGLREATWKFTPRASRNVWAWSEFRQYTRTEEWALPYLIGMCTGMLLEKAVKAGSTLSNRTVWTLIPGSVGVMAIVVGSSAYWSYPGVSQHSFFGALYATSTIGVWSICLGIITASFALGPRTWLVFWLESQWIVTPSRLTYSLYLVHFAFQLAFVGLRRTLRYVSHFDIAVSALVEVGLMVPACLALYFLLEAPIREISKGLFKSKRRSMEADLPSKERDDKTTPQFNGDINLPNQQKGCLNSGINMGLIDEYR